MDTIGICYLGFRIRHRGSLYSAFHTRPCGTSVRPCGTATVPKPSSSIRHTAFYVELSTSLSYIYIYIYLIWGGAVTCALQVTSPTQITEDTKVCVCACRQPASAGRRPADGRPWRPASVAGVGRQTASAGRKLFAVPNVMEFQNELPNTTYIYIYICIYMFDVLSLTVKVARLVFRFNV